MFLRKPSPTRDPLLSLLFDGRVLRVRLDSTRSRIVRLESGLPKTAKVKRKVKSPAASVHQSVDVESEARFSNSWRPKSQKFSDVQWPGTALPFAQIKRLHTGSINHT